MKKKIIALLCVAAVAGTLLTACGSKEEPAEQTEQVEQTEQEEPAEPAEQTAQEEPAEETEPAETAAVLEDGVYTAEFHTDSSMFHASEACDGKGTLTVENGSMVIHVSMASKNIVNLYSGLAEDAQKDGAKLIEPTTDSVTYSDGITEEVYGFDIPVPALDEEFDVALVGKKGTWYDHKVSVSNPEKTE